MKQELSLRLRQKLVMAPRLQQAIKILQMSSQELHTTIENEYSENPVLEFAEAVDNESDTDASLEQINNLAKYLDEGSEGGETPVPSREGYDFQRLPAPSESLADILLEQAALAFKDNCAYTIASYLIGCIDERGYLAAPLEELALSGKFSLEAGRSVLQVIQTFEPAGVGAADLVECLRLQAKRLGLYDGLVAAIIEQHLTAVAKNQLQKIATCESDTLLAVQKAVDKIKQLEPKPGIAYGNAHVTHIIPDICVRRINGEFLALINDYTIPSLKISDLYRNTHDLDSKTKKYIEQRVNAAIWLINSIEQRRRTLLGVAEQIIAQQKEFFLYGFAKMRPLSMQTIADTLKIHESTVSRAIANKYMDTPHGIISIRKFFTANVAVNPAGEELTAAQIKKNIQALIAAEDSSKPLSDQKICGLLAKDGINISRRTVMKYREQLGVPASSSRRQFKA